MHCERNWKTDIYHDGHKRTGIPQRNTECGSMTIYYFHNPADIHVRHIDLQFPHDEHEISLTRVYFDQKEWTHFCVYTDHLEIKDQKMYICRKMVSKCYSIYVSKIFLQQTYVLLRREVEKGTTIA